MDAAAGDEGDATLDGPVGYWVDLGVDAAGDEGVVTLDVPCGYWGRAAGAGEKGFVDDGTVALIVDAPCGLGACADNREGETGDGEDDRMSDTELGRVADWGDTADGEPKGVPAVGVGAAADSTEAGGGKVVAGGWVGKAASKPCCGDASSVNTSLSNLTSATNDAMESRSNLVSADSASRSSVADKAI